MSINVNPKNPYVFNEYRFLNATDYLNYENSLYSTIHRLINVIGPLLGISNSCLVVYLAIWQTPKHIKSFGRMLLLCSLTDIYYALCDLWCQTRYKGSKQILMFSLQGPASLYSYETQCYSVGLKTSSQILGYLLLPVQYIFRYQTIKRNTPPSLVHTFIYISMCLIITLISFYSSVQAFCTFDNPDHVDFGQFWYSEVPLPPLVIMFHTYKPAIFRAILFNVCTLGSYLLIIYFARQTMKELKTQSSYMSSRTVILQRQIGRALFAQTLTPLLPAILPVVVGQLSTQLQLQVGYFTDFHLSLMVLFPFLNSTSTLIFIIPYRNFCLRLLFPCWHSKMVRPQQASSGVPVQLNNNSVSSNRVVFVF